MIADSFHRLFTHHRCWTSGFIKGAHPNLIRKTLPTGILGKKHLWWEWMIDKELRQYLLFLKLVSLLQQYYTYISKDHFYPMVVYSHSQLLLLIHSFSNAIIRSLLQNSFFLLYKCECINRKGCVHKTHQWRFHSRLHLLLSYGFNGYSSIAISLLWFDRHENVLPLILTRYYV